MDSKVFGLVILVGFAMVVFIVFLTNNSVWQDAHRINLESLRTAEDDARAGRAPQTPITIAPPQPQAAPQPNSTAATQPQPATNSALQPQPKAEPAQTTTVAAAKQIKPSAERSGLGENRPGEQYSPVDLFFRDYEIALAQINYETDPQRQEELCRDETQRIDDYLRNQTWEFNCQILKVETLPDRLFNVAHQAPDEVDLIPDGWSVLDKVASIPLLQLANKQQIFKGDYIVYVGTPRFDTVLVDSEAENRRGEYSHLNSAKNVRPLSANQVPDANYFVCGIEIGGVPYNQTLHLTDINVRFIKGGDNIAKTSWQQQMQKQIAAGLPPQLNPAQQQALSQAGRNASSSTPPGPEVINQFNNFYSSLHPYYLYPEWLTFFRVHHFHHAHEHEPDYAKNALPANVASANARVQAVAVPAKQPPIVQKPAVASKAPVKPAPKQAQPLSSR